MDKIELLSSEAITSENLKIIYHELHSITSKKNIIDRQKDCITLLETIIEYLLHGDKSDPVILSTFADYNFISDFLCLAHASIPSINLQMIKSFSLLITNLSNKDFLYYLLSNKFINVIISNNYDNYDSDFLSYYVNFIKTISLKINAGNIALFFQGRFPLLDNALKLYNHHDPMINNVVRNIFLTIVKVKAESVINYVCSLPNITYFMFLSCRLRDHIIAINDNLSVENYDKIKSLYDDIVNDVMFFQDIFSLKINQFTYILTNSLFYYVILPLLSYSLINDNKSPKKIVSKYVCLNIFLILVFYINEEHFLNMLFATLFNETLNDKIMSLIENEPLLLSNYQYEWIMGKNCSQIKDSIIYTNVNKTTFQQFITYNFSKGFIESIKYMTGYNDYYEEIKQIVVSINSNYTDNKHIDYNNQVYKFILTEIAKYFTNDDQRDMNNYHHIVSICTGVSCGLAYYDYDQSPVHLYDKLWMDEFSLSLLKNKTKVIKNPLRQTILNNFKCKEDSLLMYSAMIMNIFLTKYNIVSKELSSSVKMLPANDFILEKTIKNVNDPNFIDINSVDLNSTSYEAYYSKIDFNDSSNKNDLINNKVITLGNYHLIPLQALDNKTMITLNSFYFLSKLERNQNTYDQNLVSLILTIFESKIIYRPFTLLILINTLYKLLIKESQFPSIKQQELKKINLTYINSIFDITNVLKQNKEVQSKSFSLFESEWKIYNKSPSLIIDSLLKEPYCLFPSSNEDKLSNYPTILSNRNTPTRLYTMHLEIFMAFHDLRCFIYDKWKTIKSEFPLTFSSVSIEINQRIPFLNWKTQIFNTRLEMNGVSFNYSMFIKQNYFIFITPDRTDQSYMITKKKYPIRHLQFDIDKKQKSNLLLKSKEEDVDMSIVIMLENNSSAKEMKHVLNEHRKNIEEEESVLLDSYFSEMMRLFKQTSE